LRHHQKKCASLLALALVAVLGGVVLAWPASASTHSLTQSECESLVEEGKQAREDLAKLIESQGQNGGTTQTTSEAVGSYVNQLLESSQINEFGFVSADAGAPLDVCLPAGTTKLTMFSEPVVLWEGSATTGIQPVTVTIPADAECGTHTLEATGPSVDESTDFTVGGSCEEAGAGGGALPRTGAAIGSALALALGLIAVGYAAIRSRRARVGS